MNSHGQNVRIERQNKRSRGKRLRRAQRKAQWAARHPVESVIGAYSYHEYRMRAIARRAAVLASLAGGYRR